MQAEALAHVFKALSEPVRVQLMALLLERGELCVCDLVDTLALPQSLVSRHLACLRRQALVTATRRGVWMHYQIAPEAREQLAPVLQMLTLLPVPAPDSASRCC